MAVHFVTTFSSATLLPTFPFSQEPIREHFSKGFKYQQQLFIVDLLSAQYLTRQPHWQPSEGGVSPSKGQGNWDAEKWRNLPRSWSWYVAEPRVMNPEMSHPNPWPLEKFIFKPQNSSCTLGYVDPDGARIQADLGDTAGSVPGKAGHDLFAAGGPCLLFVKTERKTRHHLWSTIKRSTTKRGMPIQTSHIITSFYNL